MVETGVGGEQEPVDIVRLRCLQHVLIHRHGRGEPADVLVLDAVDATDRSGEVEHVVDVVGRLDASLVGRQVRREQFNLVFEMCDLLGAAAREVVRYDDVCATADELLGEKRADEPPRR